VKPAMKFARRRRERKEKVNLRKRRGGKETKSCLLLGGQKTPLASSVEQETLCRAPVARKETKVSIIRNTF